MDSRTAAGGTKQVTALKEFCCRFIGQNLPFESVQLNPQRVPEELQTRIAFWSFPSSESRLLEYANLEAVNDKEAKQPIIRRDFSLTSRTKLDATNMVQIGLSLSGTMVAPPESALRSSSHYVSVKFDRGVITSTSSNCDCRGKWCDHVVWLCLARIRGESPCPVHPPLSESLSHLDKEELQKALQYFIEEVPGNLIPSLQKIVSKLRDKKSDISRRPGAPDLTSGGCEGDIPRWEMETRLLETQLDTFFASCEKHDVYAPLDLDASLTSNEIIRNFLVTHDPNIAFVVSWAHSKFYHFGLKVYGHSRWKKGISSQTNLATASFCKILLPVLEVCFVDPHLQSSLKLQVEGMVREMAESRDTNQGLQPALAARREKLRPTVAHFRKYFKVFEESRSGQASSSTGSSSTAGSTAFHCLSSVLRYWQIHSLLQGEEVQECPRNLCAAIFPQPPPNYTAAGIASSLHPVLRQFDAQDCLRHCHFFLSCCLPSQSDQSQNIIVQFAFKLVMYSAQGLVPRSPSKFVERSSHYQDSLLSKVSPLFEGVQLGEETRQVMVNFLEGFLKADAWEESSVFALGAIKLGLLTVDRKVLETTKAVMQYAISNPSLLLSRETADMPTQQMEDLILHFGHLLSSILLIFFRQLPHDSGQDLFESLLTAFPKPCDFLTSMTLFRKEADLSHLSTKIVEAASQLTDFTSMKERAEFSHRILPILDKGYAVKWLLKRANITSQSKLTAEESLILNAYSTALTVVSHHRWFMKQMCKQNGSEKKHLLSFQLDLLHHSVCHCGNPKWANQYTLIHYPVGDRKWSALQSDDFPPEHQMAALQYLRAHWAFSVHPQNVLGILFGRGSITVSPSSYDVACDIIQLVFCTVCDPVFPTIPCLPETLVSAVDFVAQNGSVECFIKVAGHLYRQPALVTEPKSPASRNQGTSRDVEIVFSVLTSIAQIYCRLKEEHPNSDFLHRDILLKRWKDSLDRLSQVYTQSGASIIHSFQLKVTDLALPLATLACESGTVEGYFRLALNSHMFTLTTSLGLVTARLWREYGSRQGLASSTSMLADPLFARMISPVLEDMKKSALETTQSNRTDENRVKSVLSQLAIIYRLLRLEGHMYQTVAAEVTFLCDRGIRRSLQEKFVKTSLNNVDCFWIVPPLYIDPCKQLLGSNQ